MKAFKLIGLTGFLALSLLVACSAPSGTQATWNSHDWVDRAETAAPVHNGVMVSNSAQGGD